MESKRKLIYKAITQSATIITSYVKAWQQHKRMQQYLDSDSPYSVPAHLLDDVMGSQYASQ